MTSEFRPTDVQLAEITQARQARAGTSRWFGFNDGVDATWPVAFAAGRADGDVHWNNLIAKLHIALGVPCEGLSADELVALAAAGRAAATPDPPDDDKRVRVTCFDPVTGESETQPLDPDNYILTLGERCEITACQVYANGTVQLTIKRGAT